LTKVSLANKTSSVPVTLEHIEHMGTFHDESLNPDAHAGLASFIE
jgi:hypothetical protein